MGAAYFIVVLGRTDILTLAGNEGVRLRLRRALARDLRQAFLLLLVFAILMPSRRDLFPYSSAHAGRSVRRSAARTARQRHFQGVRRIALWMIGIVLLTPFPSPCCLPHYAWTPFVSFSTLSWDLAELSATLLTRFLRT